MSEQIIESRPAGEGTSARARLEQLADILAAGVAVALPWSTSATEILIVLWLIALVPTLAPAAVLRAATTPAGGLPLLLWLMGAAGMLWADASWSERFFGLSGFHKLLVFPLLLAQFRRAGQVRWVIVGFLGSCAVLLVVSFVLAFAPDLGWRGKRTLGVPVRDYAQQSTLFAICALGLIGQAAEQWRRHAAWTAALLLGAALFVTNILYVATSRTTLVVMAVLLVVLGVRQSGWRGLIAAVVAAVALAAAGWASSPYLRERVSAAINDVRTHGSSNVVTAVGLRLDYWTKSVEFVAEAPLVGHGTGTIPSLFRRDAPVNSDPSALTNNPHNQVLSVAVQLGLIGVLLLIAMWIAHLLLFCVGGWMAWMGLVIVLGHIVGSSFNTYLFESGQGWLYVFGVGISGGAVLRQRQQFVWSVRSQ